MEELTMINYGHTYSETEPLKVLIEENMVFVAKNIRPYEKIIDEHLTMRGYEFDYYGYEKDEYIKKIDEANENLQNELLDTQSALCDVYEMLEEIING